MYAPLKGFSSGYSTVSSYAAIASSATVISTGRVPVICLLIAPPLTRKDGFTSVVFALGLPPAQGPHPMTGRAVELKVYCESCRKDGAA